MSYRVTLSYKRGHRKFRSDGRFLEKNHDIFQSCSGHQPPSCPSPLQPVSLEYFDTLSSWSRWPNSICQVPHAHDSVYTSLVPTVCHYTAFPIQKHQLKHAMFRALITSYHVSTWFCKTNLLSSAFSFGARGQDIQEPDSKGSVLPFLMFRTGLPVRGKRLPKIMFWQGHPFIFSYEMLRTLYPWLEIFNPEVKGKSCL